MSVTQATKAKVKNIAAIVTCAALVLILFGAGTGPVGAHKRR